MPGFTRRTRKSCVQTPVLDYARTDACANEDADEVVEALSRAVEIFTQGGNFNIVTNGNRFAKLLAENVTQTHIFDTQVGRIHDDACFAVNLSRCANTFH
jgi:hypothetical protein